MRETVKYERTVILPTYLANRLDELNLKGTDKTRALKFIRILVKNSKQLNDDNDIFNKVEFPRNYLVKILGGSYNKVIEKLIEGDIIIRDDFYSTKSHKCKKFALKLGEEEDFKGLKERIEELEQEVDNRIEKGKKIDNDSTMCTFLQSGLFKEYKYLEKLTPQSRELTNNFREALSYLKIKSSTLDILMADYLRGITINKFKINEQITQTSICLGDPNDKFSWRKRDKLIEKAKGEGKLLIQDKSRFFTMTEEEFIEKKKKDVLIAHSGIIRKLERGEYFASRNETNNRLDTNFTSMPSYMFKEILEQNNMIELDLCNSQMAIFTLICDLDTEDYRLFKDLALNCNLYKYIQESLGLSTEKDAKSVCFSVLFSHYKNRDPNISRFKKLFPTVMQWIDVFKKENGSKNFSITLQRKESEIFIDNLYQRIVDEGLLVFSKHDSLAVKRADEKRVREIIRTYFDEIGFEVMIR